VHPQAITFTSTPPAGAAPGDAYQVTATGGGSGNPVTFTIDPSTTSVCVISGATVAFDQPGTCLIDANQAGNASYQAAQEAQQAVTVAAFLGGHGGQLGQAITFTSTPPTKAVPGDTYQVTATGGGSGNPVRFTIDSTTASVCTISGATVTFNQPGACTIDANEDGNAQYQPAPQIEQTATVTATNSGPLAQQIKFTSTPPTDAAPGDTYLVTATGGGSGNPVTFTIDSTTTSVCTISNATVTFDQAGTCTIDANEAGNASYQAARQAQQNATDQRIPQTITFEPTPPANAVTGDGDIYQFTVTGGGSGNPVLVSIDQSSTSVCSLKGNAVRFNQAGTCLIDASEAGNTKYLPAQVKEPVTVTASSSGPPGTAGTGVTTRKPA
jgi:hypothetical protein